MKSVDRITLLFVGDDVTIHGEHGFKPMSPHFAALAHSLRAEYQVEKLKIVEPEVSRIDKYRMTKLLEGVLIALADYATLPLNVHDIEKLVPPSIKARSVSGALSRLKYLGMVTHADHKYAVSAAGKKLVADLHAKEGSE